MRIRLVFIAVAGLVASVCAALLGGTSAGATSAGASVAHYGAPMHRLNSAATTISVNWSGYAVTTPARRPFSAVHSTYVQPSITCPGTADQQIMSNWVGLDGYNNGTVEQDGTFAQCGGPNHTKPIYKAWYEMYPAGSVNVFTVHPGDVIDAAVNYSGGQFVLTIADLTTGKSASTSASCAQCQRTSAEWIIERPALCNNAFTHCFITELPDFGTTTMSSDTAQIQGLPAKSLDQFAGNIPIDMVDPVSGGGFISLDTVGPVSSGSFTARWDRSGNEVPITL